MTLTKASKKCTFTLDFDDKHVVDFLNTTHLNPGTWLEPIMMDQIAVVFSDLEKEDKSNVVGIPDSIKELEWKIGPNQEPDVKRTLNYVEITSLNKDQFQFPDKDYWEQLFDGKQLENSDHVILAPNGKIYCRPDKHGKASIRLSGQRIPSFIAYSIIFAVEVPQSNSVIYTYYCRVDPLIRIRTRD